MFLSHIFFVPLFCHIILLVVLLIFICQITHIGVFVTLLIGVSLVQHRCFISALFLVHLFAVFIARDLAVIVVVIVVISRSLPILRGHALSLLLRLILLSEILVMNAVLVHDHLDYVDKVLLPEDFHLLQTFFGGELPLH